MKFMIEYKIRTTGRSGVENIANAETLLKAFSAWAPEPGLKVLAFVVKLAGSAGYVLVESDDPKAVNAFTSKFSFWNDCEVVPVQDIDGAMEVAHAAVQWARDATS